MGWLIPNCRRGSILFARTHPQISQMADFQMTRYDTCRGQLCGRWHAMTRYDTGHVCWRQLVFSTYCIPESVSKGVIGCHPIEWKLFWGHFERPKSVMYKMWTHNSFPYINKGKVIELGIKKKIWKEWKGRSKPTAQTPEAHVASLALFEDGPSRSEPESLVDMTPAIGAAELSWGSVGCGEDRVSEIVSLGSDEGSNACTQYTYILIYIYIYLRVMNQRNRWN